MKSQLKSVWWSAALLAATTAAVAQNTVFTYQGRVTDKGTNFSGLGQFKFALVASTNDNVSYVTYWSNDGTGLNGTEPAGAVSVPVSNGLFTVTLGDTTLSHMGAISAALFAHPNLELRIWFNDGDNGFAALEPAQALTPAPYATFANTAGSLANGSVKSK